jgi:hypothetical protein
VKVSGSSTISPTVKRRWEKDGEGVPRIDRDEGPGDGVDPILDPGREDTGVLRGALHINREQQFDSLIFLILRNKEAEKRCNTSFFI